jgi:hypothetical protein
LVSRYQTILDDKKANPSFLCNNSLPVTPETMNYASVVFAGFASISLGWYFISGRKHFRGPPVPVDVSNTVKGQSLEGVDSGEAEVGMPVKMGVGEKETAI